MATIYKTMVYVRAKKPKSAWDQGVRKYALEILENAREMYGGREELNLRNYNKILLNGASDWKQYSHGGCSLIYDEDIAKRTCNKSELLKTRGGQLRPNSRESWLDVQARALYQASNRVIREAIEKIDRM